MQEIKKRRIVIASVLKPVDDPRMFEKIGRTLAAGYEVHIIGYPSRISSSRLETPSLKVHCLTFFSRISAGRILAPLTVLKLVRELRPEVLVVCTHELLITALLSRLLTRCSVVYDVQENYARNIYYGETVLWIMKFPLASLIRVKEWISSHFIEHFFLAERSYADELKFIRRNYTVLENKLQNIPGDSIYRRRTTRDEIRLLFSGTLAETTGVFVAMRLAERLHAEDERIVLYIVGYARQKAVQDEIYRLAKSKSYIRLIGITVLVPHSEIIEWITKTDFGVVSYPDNPSTRTSIPTKLYEYMGHRLPVLLTDNPVWVSFCGSYQAAVLFNESKIDPRALLDSMFHTAFYTRFPKEVFWESEEHKLNKIMNSILSNT